MRQGGAACVCEGEGVGDPGPEQRAGSAEEGGGGEVSAVPACMGSHLHCVCLRQGAKGVSSVSACAGTPFGMQVAYKMKLHAPGMHVI